MIDTIVKFFKNDKSYVPIRATIMGCGGTGKSYIINNTDNCKTDHKIKFHLNGWSFIGRSSVQCPRINIASFTWNRGYQTRGQYYTEGSRQITESAQKFPLFDHRRKRHVEFYHPRCYREKQCTVDKIVKKSGEEF